jgi:plastocyanin
MQQILSRMIVAAVVATIPSLGATSPHTADGERIVIEIQGFEFVPGNPAVKPGDVVVWINNDIVPHTVTSRDQSWDSGKVDGGGVWEMVVTADMIQEYFCRFHPSMIGRLDVRSN